MLFLILMSSMCLALVSCPGNVRSSLELPSTLHILPGWVYLGYWHRCSDDSCMVPTVVSIDVSVSVLSVIISECLNI